jgi:hypothetical protein
VVLILTCVVVGASPRPTRICRSIAFSGRLPGGGTATGPMKIRHPQPRRRLLVSSHFNYVRFRRPSVVVPRSSSASTSVAYLISSIVRLRLHRASARSDTHKMHLCDALTHSPMVHPFSTGVGCSSGRGVGFSLARLRSPAVLCVCTLSSLRPF